MNEREKTMILEAKLQLRDDEDLSFTERHELAVINQQRILGAAKEAVLAVLQEAEDADTRPAGATIPAAERSGISIDNIRTAMLMLEAGQQIRWNGNEGRYELNESAK